MKKILLIGLIITCVVAQAANLYTDPQKPIIIDAFQKEIIIQLPSNPTTGYSWQLLAYNQHLFTSVQHAFIPPNRNLIGAGGMEQWIFQINPQYDFTRPENNTINFAYKRPWLKEVGRTATFQIKMKRPLPSNPASVNER